MTIVIDSEGIVKYTAMIYSERCMAESGNHEIVGSETAESSQAPRLDIYTNQCFEELKNTFPEFTPEQLVRAWQLSRKLAKERIAIEDSADNDPLTEVLRRQGFEKRLDEKFRQYHREFKAGKREKINDAVLFIDLDNFKQLNDTYGHLVGDQVLNLTGQLLNRGVRPTDVVGRYGGEEFVVYLGGATLENAINIADRFRTNLPISVTNTLTRLGWNQTISIGIIQVPETSALEQLGSQNGRYELIAQLMKQADTTHYKGAKKAGKDRIGVMLENGQIQTAFVNNATTPGQPPTIAYREPLLQEAV